MCKAHVSAQMVRNGWLHLTLYSSATSQPLSSLLKTSARRCRSHNPEKSTRANRKDCEEEEGCYASPQCRDRIKRKPILVTKQFRSAVTCRTLAPFTKDDKTQTFTNKEIEHTQAPA
jgi:hypothetical protein